MTDIFKLLFREGDTLKSLQREILSTGISLVTSPFYSKLYIGSDSFNTESKLFRLFPDEMKYFQTFRKKSAMVSDYFILELKTSSVIPILLPEKTLLIIRKDRCYDLSLHFYGLHANKARKLMETYLLDKPKDSGKTTSANGSQKIRVSSIGIDEDGEAYSNNGHKIPVKPLSEIVITPENRNILTSYLTRWSSSRELFEKLGVTHQVGILLYGPPGTGKTSVAKAISLMLNRPLYTINASTFPTIVPDFSNLSGGIILFEDIDYIFGGTSGNEVRSVNEVTSAASEAKAKANALLQTLDGTGSYPDIIYIATTNSIEKLNEAMTRDGRFDLKIHMDNIASVAEAKKLCLSMTLSEDQADKLLADETLPINPAALQNKCVQELFKNMTSVTSEEVANEVSEEATNVNEVASVDEITSIFDLMF